MRVENTYSGTATSMTKQKADEDVRAKLGLCASFLDRHA
jgi:hypothetical protein